jgi:hypothetical protein
LPALDPAILGSDDPTSAHPAPADPGLRRLRDRLARAQAGDRELDGRVLCGLFGYRFLAWDADGLLYGRPDDGEPVRVEAEQVARLTGSLDAVAALLSLVAPDWALTATIRPDGSSAQLAEDPPPFRRSAVWRAGPGADGAARAALLALLSVIEGDADGAA